VHSRESVPPVNTIQSAGEDVGHELITWEENPGDRIPIAGLHTQQKVRTVYRKAPEVRERFESGKLLLYNTKTRKMIVLEDMGIGVWNLLSEKPLEEIEAILLDYHPHEREKIQVYLKKFIHDLLNQKFLTEDG
jgi:hypothetical protein